MGMGLPIASGTAVALSTTESANLVQSTYDYIKPGKIRLFCKGSDATVRINFFIDGQQICRRMQLPCSGTAGTLDTSANLIAEINTMGGRVEITGVATAGTPTVDYILTHEGIFGGNVLSKLFGRR